MRRDWKLISLLRLAVVPLFVIVALFVAWKLGYFELDKRRQLVNMVERMRGVPGAEIVYVVAFALAITILLPAWIASLVGGALFGVWKGSLLAWVGGLVGTILTHLLARHVARAPMRKLFGEHRLLRQLREHDDVMELLRLRIMPVAPFAVLDYVAGVAGVSLRRLLLATMLGVIPSVIAYTYVGAELIRGLVTRSEASRTALWIAGGVTVGMLLASVVPGLLRRLRE
ncbi:MAG TPA: VTT domain-containing protein [Gemmatimonadaceae bacterium]|jgi:uncharacterized membrane protein YdjX (TVP38/TMEM64 family)